MSKTLATSKRSFTPIPVQLILDGHAKMQRVFLQLTGHKVRDGADLGQAQRRLGRITLAKVEGPDHQIATARGRKLEAFEIRWTGVSIDRLVRAHLLLVSLHEQLGHLQCAPKRQSWNGNT